jgi:DNA-damage-inducible protein D
MQKELIAGFLPTLTIKAKDIAAELTSHNVIEKNLKGDTAISKEHVDNNTAIRKMLKQRGVQPEQLPADEDVKKIATQIKNWREKLSTDIKKRN